MWLDVLVPFVSCFDLSSYLLKSPAGECVDFDVVWWEEGEVVGVGGSWRGESGWEEEGKGRGSVVVVVGWDGEKVGHIRMQTFPLVLFD